MVGRLSALGKVVTAIFCALRLAAACSAGPADIVSAAESLPADVDLIVVIENAADLRRGAAGAPLGGLAGALFEFADTRERWRDFSRTLGWPEDEAFDALLGRRAMLVGRGIWDGPPRWALLTEIDADAEARLRKRLPVAPRKIAWRTPVLSVEARFELAIIKGRQGAIALVAPNESAALFDELLATAAARAPAARGPAALRDLRAIQAAHDIDSPQALFYTRLPPGVGGWAGAVAQLDGAWLRAAIIARPEQAPDPVTPWPMGEFNAMEKDALLAIMERASGAGARPGGLGAGAIGDLLWAAPDSPLKPFLGDRHALAIYPAEGHPGLDIVAAVQLTDAFAAAIAGDDMMNGLIQWFSERVQKGAWRFEFNGDFPEALRVATILPADQSAIPFVAERGLEVAWTYRRSRREGDPSGWLVCGLNPQRVVRTADAIISAKPDRSLKPFLSVGAVRPSALFETLKQTGRPLQKPFAGLRWVESVEWTTLTTGDGARVRGSARAIEGGVRARLRALE